jgi:hypothetical protein
MRDLYLIFLFNLGLLPGELGLTAGVMVKDGFFNWVNFSCCLGVWLTVNFFVAAAISQRMDEGTNVK